LEDSSSDSTVFPIFSLFGLNFRATLKVLIQCVEISVCLMPFAVSKESPIGREL